jgi:hypothetical protein
MLTLARSVVMVALLAGLAGCGQIPETPPPPDATIARPTVTAAASPALTPNRILATPGPTPPFSQMEAAEVAASVALDVELFYSERWMRVKQVVDLENSSLDAWDDLVFNVPLNYLSGTFHLDAMTVTLPDSVQEGVPSFPDGETILRVPLPRPVLPGESARIEMAYRAVIPPVASTDWPPIGVTGWTFHLIQAGEWYPALVPYIDDEGWYTWLYHPVGDPTVYPLADYTLTVQADDGVIVAGSGPVTGASADLPGLQADGSWRFQIEQGRGIAFLASDEYEVAVGDVSGVPVYSYYLAEHGEAGLAALQIAAESIDLFERLYGDYPYPTLTVAENGFFGGMEYSGLISVTDYAYLTYYGQPSSVLHLLVPHETAHQWWYGAVGNDQANEPWLDESLAFYSELLYFEHLHPELSGWWWNTRVFSHDLYGPVDATIYSYAASDDFIPSMYGQAAQFVHELRSLMGDEAFFAFLRDYYQANRWQLATADDYFAAVRRHTDADLGPLLRAYFANPEH